MHKHPKWTCGSLCWTVQNAIIRTSWGHDKTFTERERERESYFRANFHAPVWDQGYKQLPADESDHCLILLAAMKCKYDKYCNMTKGIIANNLIIAHDKIKSLHLNIWTEGRGWVSIWLNLVYKVNAQWDVNFKPTTNPYLSINEWIS